MTIPSAVCAVALALLSGCSSDEPTAAGPAAPAASASPSAAPAVPSSAPAAGPAASAPAAANPADAALCQQVIAAKTALNAELKRVVSPDGKVPPAEAKRVMTGLAAALSDLADSGDGEIAKALDGLSAEASKAAGTADPMRAALSPTFDAAGRRVDKACGAA